MVLDKLFGWGRKKRVDPGILFGRYSDNNKTVEKVNQWTKADQLFREKEYQKSIDAFFDYLRDDELENVVLERNEKEGSFHFYQGSKIVRGRFDQERLEAEVTLAKMPEPSVPVMRRLLEMNFSLYYTRYALEGEKLLMRFDSDLATANPNKLYYGLKELATKADKQDDLLVHEFVFLQPFDTGHIIEIHAEEKQIKYDFLLKWINGTLDRISAFDAEKFSGGIAYLLLTLAFRIDYLLCPEGKLLNELEKIVESYYRKDEKLTIDRNQAMMDGFNKILNKTKDEVFSCLFRSKHTFAIASPRNHKSLAESINTAIQNMFWYRDNKYQDIANRVLEYGFAFSMYSYSLPRPLSDLYKLFMEVNYGEYFSALGFGTPLYHADTNYFAGDEIIDIIDEIVDAWEKKYTKLMFRTKRLQFDNLINFNHSFVSEIAELNLDV